MIRFFILVTIIWAMTADPLAAQTDTTFTYQGELEQSGVPANGVFKMDFSLWDAVFGGGQIGSIFILNNVSVKDGIFSVNLDFGAAAFNDSGRWLEISVNDIGLEPRQAITRAPYAIHTRGIFVSGDKRVGIGTTNPQSDLHINQSGSVTGTGGITHQYLDNRWKVGIAGTLHYFFGQSGATTGNYNFRSFVHNATGAFTISSDRSLKKNIEPAEPVLARVMDLKPSRYHFKSNGDSLPRQYGFIAQDVEEQFPDLVSTLDDGKKGLSYSNFSVLAIKAIQEQQAIIDDIQHQIGQLRQQVARQP